MSDRRSIGYSIAQEAQREGAEILLTSFGRMMSITQMTAKKLDPVPDILEMDVTKPSDIAEAVKETEKRWDRVDGLVHSVAFAPADALGGQFLNTPWESVATALQVSAFSFKEMARGFLQKRKSADLKRRRDRKSTRLNSSHVAISYAVFCLKKKKKAQVISACPTQHIATSLSHSAGFHLSTTPAEPIAVSLSTPHTALISTHVLHHSGDIRK